MDDLFWTIFFILNLNKKNKALTLADIGQFSEDGKTFYLTPIDWFCHYEEKTMERVLEERAVFAESVALSGETVKVVWKICFDSKKKDQGGGIQSPSSFFELYVKLFPEVFFEIEIRNTLFTKLVKALVKYCDYKERIKVKFVDAELRVPDSACDTLRFPDLKIEANGTYIYSVLYTFIDCYAHPDNDAKGSIFTTFDFEFNGSCKKITRQNLKSILNLPFPKPGEMVLRGGIRSWQWNIVVESGAWKRLEKLCLIKDRASLSFFNCFENTKSYAQLPMVAMERFPKKVILIRFNSSDFDKLLEEDTIFQTTDLLCEECHIPASTVELFEKVFPSLESLSLMECEYLYFDASANHPFLRLFRLSSNTIKLRVGRLTIRSPEMAACLLWALKRVRAKDADITYVLEDSKDLDEELPWRRDFSLASQYEKLEAESPGSEFPYSIETLCLKLTEHDYIRLEYPDRWGLRKTHMTEFIRLVLVVGSKVKNLVFHSNQNIFLGHVEPFPDLERLEVKNILVYDPDADRDKRTEPSFFDAVSSEKSPKLHDLSIYCDIYAPTHEKFVYPIIENTMKYLRSFPCGQIKNLKFPYPILIYTGWTDNLDRLFYYKKYKALLDEYGKLLEDKKYEVVSLHDDYLNEPFYVKFVRDTHVIPYWIPAMKTQLLDITTLDPDTIGIVISYLDEIVI